MANQVHSTGRGGAGNIGEDPHTYVDGDIIREGTAGVSGRPVAGTAANNAGDYSSGRGGAGNMVHPDNARAAVLSEDVVPETATRHPEGYENYHTGRGGVGNVHRDEFGGHSGPQLGQHKDHGAAKHQHHPVEGLVEKAKHAIGLDKKKDGETK